MGQNMPIDFDKIELEGIVIPINKPIDYTSFDVVNRVKRYFKGKIGHAGTLDPLADGVLIIALGKMTKQINVIQDTDKQYLATLYLGATRPSFDKETEIDKTFDTSHITMALLEEKANLFRGEISQQPPIYSAVKVNGKRAYNYAREGEAVEIKFRNQYIYNLDIESFELPLLKLNIKCNKGTYIRSLANDFGLALGAGAYLEQLTRTAVGDYQLSDCYELEDVIDQFKEHKIAISQ